MRERLVTSLAEHGLHLSPLLGLRHHQRVKPRPKIYGNELQKMELLSQEFHSIFWNLLLR
jgi:hypothetical protein